MRTFCCTAGCTDKKRPIPQITGAISFRMRQWLQPIRACRTGETGADMLSCTCKSKKVDRVRIAARDRNRKGGNKHEKRIFGFADRRHSADCGACRLQRKVRVGTQRLLRLRLLCPRLRCLHARLRRLHGMLRHGRLHGVFCGRAELKNDLCKKEPCGSFFRALFLPVTAWRGPKRAASRGSARADASRLRWNVC